MHTVVFLDRSSLGANVRAPGFAHSWRDHDRTAAAEVVNRLAGATIAVSNKVPLREAALAHLPQLRMIAVAATGTDIVDLAACRARGIVVSNIRNYATASLPEHVFALALALRRNLIGYRNDVEHGLWQRADTFCLLTYPIGDLAGSTLGLIGFGALGRSVAKLGLAFGMQVIAYDPMPQAMPEVRMTDVDDILRRSDIVSLHLPLTEETRNLIGREELARMKPGALLINTARGGLVDEHALADALRAGTIGGAGFDVLTMEPPPDDNPLLQLRQSNFILTPHVAWASAQAMQALADQLVDNIEAFVAGAPVNVVT
ncbi:MAG: D-2-hydroxyacid dehydrogenase [Betaproteobacteria bacterium]